VDFLFVRREKKYAKQTRVNPSHAGTNPSTPEFFGVVKPETN
jgi:hypothetical protein